MRECLCQANLMFVKQFLRPFRARQAKQLASGLVENKKKLNLSVAKKELVISLTGIVTPFSIQKQASASLNGIQNTVQSNYATNNQQQKTVPSLGIAPTRVCE